MLPKIDPQTVLLVDDYDASIYHSRVMVLENHRFDNVISANGCEEALAYLGEGLTRGQIPALIFLDINMPRLTGWDFLDMIQSNPDLNQLDLNIIMLTTTMNPEEQQRGMAHPLVKDFRIKPLTAEYVETIARRYLAALDQ